MPMSGTEHRRASAFIGGFKTTALVPFLSLFFYQSTMPPGRNLTSL